MSDSNQNSGSSTLAETPVKHEVKASGDQKNSKENGTPKVPNGKNSDF